MDNASDRAVQRLLHFEDCQSAIDGLFSQSYEAAGLAAFTSFLKFARRISNLSVYNAMLVAVQRPGATAVATRRKWWQTHRRQVAPDAVPIVILQPFGPVLFVYDLADTHGPKLSGEQESPLFATGRLDDKTYNRVRKAARENGVEVAETDQYGALLAGTAAGFGSLPDTTGESFRVKLNSKHDLPSRFATLAHELGHVYCGHVGVGPNGRWPKRMNLTLAQKELEAEAVAWLVCQRNGVTSRSAEYLHSLISPESVKGVSMYAIFEAANRVEARTPAQSK